MDLDQLTELFRRLGAKTPESWARSQIDEGMPQLARYLFLRQAWRSIVSETDAAWIDARITSAEEDANAPGAGTGHALKRLRARGATTEELTDLVRGMQYEALFDFCHLLDDPGDIEEGVDMHWTLVQTDAEGSTLGPIEALHESLLETDPTGREMRPRT